MKKTNIKLKTKQILYGIFAVVLTFAYFPNIASAQQIMTRKVVLGSSQAGLYTTYSFTFTAAQSTPI